jgi:hypothetical protein
LQFLDLARPADPLDGRAVHDRNARGIVATILEPAQALHQYRDDISLGNGADDSTHWQALLVGSGGQVLEIAALPAIVAVFAARKIA